jgi:hypothetical protein
MEKINKYLTIFKGILISSLILIIVGLFALRTPVVLAQSSTPLSNIHHVFVIVMENHDWSSISPSAAPYINNTLLKIGAHANNYHNIPIALGSLHPSEPNYMWLEGGTNVYPNFTFTTDNNSSSSNSTNSVAHLATLLSGHGLSWKGYQENMSAGTCPISSSGQYAAKHNPFVFFQDISGNPPLANNANCASHYSVLTAATLQNDLNSGNVASYNFLTPNLCNDMHDCSVATGDTWLSTYIPIIMNSALYKKDGAIFITWDEGGSGNNPIGMIMLSPYIKQNYSNSIQYSHASMVKTVEDIFGLTPYVGHAADSSTLNLADFFTTTPGLPPSPTSAPVPTATPTLAPKPTLTSVPQPTIKPTVKPTQIPSVAPTVPPVPSVAPQCPVLPTNSGVAQTLINIGSSGTYYVWSRMQSTGDNANSYWLQIDNNCGVNVGDLNGMPTGVWTWVNYQDGNQTSKISMNLTQGIHTIKLIGREINTKLDKVILVNDPSCVPTGFGDNCPAVNPSPTAVPINNPSPSPSLSPLPTHAPDATLTPKEERHPTDIDNTPTHGVGGSGGTNGTTLTPTADASLESDSPNNNFGKDNTLWVDGSPVRITYIRFNLDSLAGKQIKSAKLELSVNNYTKATQTLKLVDNTSWAESTITYNNRPLESGTVLGTLNGGNAGDTKSIDLTSIIAQKAGGAITISISQTATDGIGYNSKESSKGPRLIVTY